MKQTSKAPRSTPHTSHPAKSAKRRPAASGPESAALTLDAAAPADPEATQAPFDLLERAPHRTLHEHAYGQIREALMVGRFVPGQKMTIRGLAEALSISPTPVREALHRLTAEGALRAEPNRRVVVPRLSSEEFRELRAIRLALEGLATERAVPLITASEIESLCAIDAQIRALRREGRTSASIRSIYEFHHTLYAAARMPTLKHLIEGLWLRNGPYLQLLFPDYAGREQGQLRARTLAAVVRRDAKAARLAMQADLDQTAEYLAGLLDAKETPREPAAPAGRAKAGR